ncbi:hypothetical protein SSCG_00173 [Streptomyces clavuligerus]|nr:hypothetical protein SSCG_00173 [Streptomyces clavuligerus]
MVQRVDSGDVRRGRDSGTAEKQLGRRGAVLSKSAPAPMTLCLRLVVGGVFAICSTGRSALAHIPRHIAFRGIPRRPADRPGARFHHGFLRAGQWMQEK